MAVGDAERLVGLCASLGARAERRVEQELHDRVGLR
jgi:hypothetical protein